MVEILDNVSESCAVKDEFEQIQSLASPKHLDVRSIAKLTNSNILTLDAHHSSNQFLLVGGAQNGEIVLWNGLNKTVRMRIHAGAVNDLKVGRDSRVWTASADGFVKCLDLVTQKLEIMAEIGKTLPGKEVKDELFWIKDLPEADLRLVGTSNFIYRFDKRMEDASAFTNVSSGCKPMVRQKIDNCESLIDL